MSTMRLVALGFVVMLASAYLSSAGLVAFKVLESPSPPVYSTRLPDYGLVAFFQNDGSVTFVHESGFGHALNFSCHIGHAHQGSAYVIAGAGSGTVRLLVAQSDRMFQLICSALSKSCDPQFPIVPLPISPQAIVLDMAQVDENEDLIYATTIDSFFVFSSTAMKVLATFKWSGKPYMAQYSMDHAHIVQSAMRSDGHVVLISLAGAQPTLPGASASSIDSSGSYPSLPYTRPGMIISLLVRNEDFSPSISLITTTLLDTSPMTLHPPHDPPGNRIFYWTQISNDSRYAYVNSVGGWKNSPTVHIPLDFATNIADNTFTHHSGEQLKKNFNPSNQISLSPSCLGEFAGTGAGLLSIGNRNSSQWFYGLHFAYGQNLPPEIMLTNVDWHPANAGVMMFAQQPSPMIPYVHGIVQTPNGRYAIETYDFSGMGKPSQKIAKNDQIFREFLENSKSLERSSNTANPIQIADKNQPHSRPLITSAKAMDEIMAQNCVPSNCVFDDPGDCPPDHCWSFGATSGFFCCIRPPM